VQDSKCATQSGTRHGRHAEVRDGKPRSESKPKSLWSRMTLHRSMSDSNPESGSDVNAIIGGVPACIFGQFGEVIVFMEPLLEPQVQSLFTLGMIISLFLACEITLIYCDFSLNTVLVS